jgi:hypothetical protein
MNVTYEIGKTPFVITALKRSTYRSNNAPAVMAIVHVEGDIEENPVSVNLLGKSEHVAPAFYCKNYSECEAMYNALVQAGWLVPTGKTEATGYVNVPLCTIGPNAVVQ